MIDRRLQARPVSSLPTNQILREGAGHGCSNLILDHGHKSGANPTLGTLRSFGGAFRGLGIDLPGSAHGLKEIAHEAVQQIELGGRLR